jgi:uncharacterized protein YndB with AHSA1/START domain
MGHPFEEHSEAEVPATPEEVWAAIATGPGIDSWFMGRSDVQPGADGTVRTTMGEYTMESGVTAWDPARRLAYRSGEAPDGRFIAFDFLIEGREGGSTVLRNVSTGFLPGDDWADEYEAMKLGGALYFGTLAEYLTYFTGRLALPVTASGPAGTTWASDRAAIVRSLGLPGSAGHGDRVSFTAGGIGQENGVVYFTNAATIGIRTPDALYRFIRGFGRPLVADGKLFAPKADPAGAQLAWESWLSQVLSPKG